MSRKRKTSDVVFQGLEAGLRMFRWVVVILLVLFVFSGFQKVEPDSVGLLLRFGKLQGATPGEQIKQPGLVLAFPFPVDRVIKAPGREREGQVVIDEVWKELAPEESGAPATDTIDPVREGYCLTGDQNLIQTKVVVRYKVTDPVAYALWVDEQDRDAILRDVVLASLVQTVAGWDIDDALRLQRSDAQSADGTQEWLAQTVWRLAQQRLDALGADGGTPGCGITISALQFEENHPPRHVAAEFQQVQDEKNAKETLRQQALGDATAEVPKAEAERNRMVQEAMAYQSTLVANANAELAEFKQLYEEYKKNPDLVRHRLYVETVEQVFQNVKKLFVSPDSRVIISDKETDKGARKP